MAKRARRVSLRELDGSPQVVETLRRTRRLLPGDPGFGDPLSAAGRDGAGRVARLADKLYDDEPRASRELALSALQIWNAVLVRTGRGHGNQQVTIVFTDLVGFSSWALRVGDDETLRLLREVHSTLEPCMTRRRGKVVKRLGDGVMAVFPSAQLAFEAVENGRAGLREIEVSGFQPQLRAGLHTGLPKVIGGDYLGVDVNIAARLCDKAGPDETLVSDSAVAELDPAKVTTKRKKLLPFSTIKGVPDDLGVYTATAASPDAR